MKTYSLTSNWLRNRIAYLGPNSMLFLYYKHTHSKFSSPVFYHINPPIAAISFQTAF